MKKWKKALIALAISVFAIGAASCKGGGNPPADPPATEEPGTQEYTVTFDRNNSMAKLKDANGQNVQKTKKYVEGTTLTIKTEALANYEFKGWEVDGVIISTEFTYTFTVTQDTVVKAIFEEKKCTVTFVSNNETISTQQVKRNEKATLPQTPTRLGYTFTGWKSNVSGIDVDDNITSDVVFTAGWTAKNFTVTFNSDGGSAVSNQTVQEGEKATLPENPTKGEMRFGGWYLGEQPYDFNAPVMGDVALTAKWKDKFITVAFDADNGSAITEEQLESGERVAEPTAPVKEGYIFLGWFVEGALEAYDFSTPVTNDFVLKAKWKDKYVTVSFDADNGSTIEEERVEDGTAVAKPADPVKPGHTFLGWYTDGALEAYDFSTVVTGSFTLTAKWDVNQYMLTVVAGTGGTVAAVDGRYDYGTQVEISATADAGYRFVKWSDGNDSATRTIVVTGDITLTAEFAEAEKSVVKLTVEGVDASKITLDGAGAYATGEQATVVAGACEGYTFVGWFKDGDSNPVSTESTYQFAVTSDVTLTAKFSVNTYAVTATATAGGSVGGGATYQYGESATLTATAEAGYLFVGWFEDGALEPVFTEPTYTFTVTKQIALTAKFKIDTRKTISLTVEGVAPSQVTLDGAGVYWEGEQATITVGACVGYTFTGWYDSDGKVSDLITYTFTVTKEITLTAKFVLNTYTITAMATAGGIAQGSGEYDHGESVTLEAIADENYLFIGWYENGGAEPVFEEAVYQFVATAGRTLTAKFEREITTHVIDAVAENPSMGTIKGKGTYNYGDTVTLTATPEYGYKFVNWYDESGATVSTSNVYSFKVEGDVMLTAKFEAATYSINARSESTSKGTVTGNGKYTHDEQVTLVATPKQGYVFEGWYENGYKISSAAATYQFLARGNRTLTAKFSKMTYTITVSAGTGGAAYVRLDATENVTTINSVSANTPVYLTAVAEEGYA